MRFGFPSILRNGPLCSAIKLGYVPNRSFKSKLKIKWVRPPKVPHYDPRHSGDLAPMSKIDLATTRLFFKDNPELADANEQVKKVFSLDFQYTKHTLALYREMMADRVRRHEYDKRSHEVKIAYMTANIRFYQTFVDETPYIRKYKVKLLELVSKRKKLLKHLRRWDYKRFEWLLEQLELEYRPPPTIFDTVTRKKSLKLLTDLHCETLKEKRLAEYRRQLNSQKIPFLEEKISKLKWVQAEEDKYNLPSTVSEDDINECIQTLEKVKLELKGTEVQERPIHPYNIEVYEP